MDITVLVASITMKKNHTNDFGPHYLNLYLGSLIYINRLCTVFFIMYLPQKLLSTSAANCEADFLNHFGKEWQKRKHFLFF